MAQSAVGSYSNPLKKFKCVHLPDPFTDLVRSWLTPA